MHMKDTPLWSPSRDKVAKSKMFVFMKAVNSHFKRNMETYEQLHRWSVEHSAEFWKFWATYSNIPFFQEEGETVMFPEQLEESRWFPQYWLNYTQKIMQYTGNKTAIIAYSERGKRHKISRDQLIEQVKKAARGLQYLGVTPGSCVVGVMPNITETVVIMLACASIGAIWSCCSTDFGAEAIVARLNQINPKVLITAESYDYAGKTFYLQDKIGQVLKKIPTINHTIIVPFQEEKTAKMWVKTSEETVPLQLWNNFLNLDATDYHHFSCTPVLFNHPLCILYSSGTTSAPKCIVHGHGGTLLQHLKEHQLHTNIQEKDCMFYYTSYSWMM